MVRNYKGNPVLAIWGRAARVIDEVPVIALGFFLERGPRLFETIHRLGSGTPAG